MFYMNLLTKKEPVCHKLFVSNFFLSAYRMRKNEKVAVCEKIFFRRQKYNLFRCFLILYSLESLFFDESLGNQLFITINLDEVYSRRKMLKGYSQAHSFHRHLPNLPTIAVI